MNIKQAKTQIQNAMTAYFTKDPLADTQFCGNLDRGSILSPHHFYFPALVQRQSHHLNHPFHPFLPLFWLKIMQKRLKNLFCI